MIPTKLLQVSIALLLAAAPAYADVLANYNFTSGRASTDTDPNSTASTFDGGPGFQSAGVDNSVIDATRGNPAPSVTIDSTFTDGANQGQAVNANDFFTFNISPVSGFSFNFSSLSFDYANTSGTATFPVENFFVRSSADGFASNLAGAVTAGTAAAGAFVNTSINLSNNALLQNVTSTLEFRIYVYDGTNTAGRGAALDNIILNGTTAAVPEPSTWAMMVAGAGLLGATQRLRRKR